MKIDNLLADHGSNIYYDPAFRNVLEDHMSFLKTHPDTKKINIESVYAYKYVGDLSGLLKHYNIDIYLHWVIMRMNGFTSFNEAGENIVELLLPDSRAIERIRQLHSTIQNKMKT